MEEEECPRRNSDVFAGLNWELTEQGKRLQEALDLALDNFQVGLHHPLHDNSIGTGTRLVGMGNCAEDALFSQRALCTLEASSFPHIANRIVHIAHRTPHSSSSNLHRMVHCSHCAARPAGPLCALHTRTAHSTLR